MKNVNVLLAVVLCAGLCVLFRLFNRSADDSLGWSPNELYMQSISSGEGASFTSANLSGGNVSNDGVAVSMRNGSFSLRTRARHASSPNSLVANGVPEKSADFRGALSPNSPIASSPNSLIGHMTSSAEYHSFGGGHSGNMGSAMTGMTNSGNVAASFAYSSPSYGVANSGLSSYSPITLSSGTDGIQVMSAEQALISASSTASGLFGSAMQNTYGTATYGEYLGMSGSKPSGVRGRQNAAPGVGQTWLNWLAMYGGSYGRYDESTGTWYYDTYQLRAAYDAFCAAWNESMGKKPTWDEWLAWFMASEGDGNGFDWSDGDKNWTYQFVPVGNILPLFLMALLYMIILFVKRNKTAQL